MPFAFAFAFAFDALGSTHRYAFRLAVTRRCSGDAFFVRWSCGRRCCLSAAPTGASSLVDWPELFRLSTPQAKTDTFDILWAFNGDGVGEKALSSYRSSKEARYVGAWYVVNTKAPRETRFTRAVRVQKKEERKKEAGQWSSWSGPRSMTATSIYTA